MTVLAAVLVLTGAATTTGQILTWLTPTDASTQSVTAPDRDYDGVAVPFAVDYLSWDESDRDSRQTALSRSAASETRVDGWQGAGRQWADSPAVVGIARAGDDRAVVTVRVRVTPFADADGAASGSSSDATSGSTPDSSPERSRERSEPPGSESKDVPNVASGPAPDATRGATGKSRWLNLAVPVARQGDRVVVTAPPALVGSPQTTVGRPAVPGASATEDTAFARDTREVITTLVSAYGTGELAYARVAGTSFTGLANAATVEAVASWRVQNADENADRLARLGDVTVTWTLSGHAGALMCTYRVELRKDGGRWYLESIGVASEAVT